MGNNFCISTTALAAVYQSITEMFMGHRQSEDYVDPKVSKKRLTANHFSANNTGALNKRELPISSLFEADSNQNLTNKILLLLSQTHKAHCFKLKR
jgi:hypothetical protein